MLEPIDFAQLYLQQADARRVRSPTPRKPATPDPD